MGWSLDIVSDREITVEEVDSFIKEIPESLTHSWGVSKQNGFWSLATDVSFPTGNVLHVSGAYFSLPKAQDMTNWLARMLVEKGHIIRIKNESY